MWIDDGDRGILIVLTEASKTVVRVIIICYSTYVYKSSTFAFFVQGYQPPLCFVYLKQYNIDNKIETRF